MNEETSQNPRTPEQTDTARPQGGPPRCVIVGMGASTGGLAAFETFFTPMPPDSGMAFVLVQHLAPDRASLLPELLAQYTRMPVQQATAALHVEPNHVYIIPPDATMTIASGRLHVLSPPEEARGYRCFTGDILSSDILTFLAQSGVPRLTKPFTAAAVRHAIAEALRAG